MAFLARIRTKLVCDPKCLRRQTDVDRVVDALVRVERIVAAVLHQVDFGDTDPHGLGQLREQQGIDFQVRTPTWR